MATDTTTTVIIKVLMSILSTASPRGKLGYKNTLALNILMTFLFKARQYKVDNFSATPKAAYIPLVSLKINGLGEQQRRKIIIKTIIMIL